MCLIMLQGLVSALGRENSEVGASYIYIAALASVGFYKLLIHISLTFLSLLAEAEYWEDVRRTNAQTNYAKNFHTAADKKHKMPLEGPLDQII